MRSGGYEYRGIEARAHVPLRSTAWVCRSWTSRAAAFSTNFFFFSSLFSFPADAVKVPGRAGGRFRPPSAPPPSLTARGAGLTCPGTTAKYYTRQGGLLGSGWCTIYSPGKQLNAYIERRGFRTLVLFIYHSNTECILPTCAYGVELS